MFSPHCAISRSRQTKWGNVQHSRQPIATAKNIHNQAIAGIQEKTTPTIKRIVSVFLVFTNKTIGYSFRQVLIIILVYAGAVS